MFQAPYRVLTISDDDRYEPAPGVLFGRQAEQVVLLSLRGQSYFTLNASGSMIWDALVGGATVESAAEQLADSFDISLYEAKSDLRAFVERLSQRGLLRLNTQASNPRRGEAAVSHNLGGIAQLPSILKCLLTLTAVALKLRFMTPGVMLFAAAGDAAAEPDLSQEFRVELTRRVRMAAACFPKNPTCLPQSIAIIVLLRRMGFLPTLRIGVYPYPFGAHAWVECGGLPVNETPESLMRYRSFASLAPEQRS